MFENLVCPISRVRIDRNVVRTNGLLTTALLITYVVTRAPWIIVPVGLDYVLRARMGGPMSPMAQVAQRVARALGLPFRAMDKAPKVFASRIGVCFAMGAALAHFVAPSVAVWLAGTLAVFTTLESVFDLCVGCVVYTYVALPLYRARDAVASMALFGDLPEPMLAGLAEGFEKVTFPQGEQVITEGSPGTEMFVIDAGEVEVYRGEGDARTVVTTYKARDHFGELAFLTGKPRSASVRARTPLTVYRLTKSELDALLERHPGMRAILERTAAERLAEVAASRVV
ncbi:MAG: DUF4395 family protein [Polyangiales bacterium]